MKSGSCRWFFRPSCFGPSNTEKCSAWERPSRVVIDVPQARLADALRGHEAASVIAANTWAVSTIATQELDDGGVVVRVIVTLARPGRYDVKTEGNERYDEELYFLHNTFSLVECPVPLFPCRSTN